MQPPVLQGFFCGHLTVNLKDPRNLICCPEQGCNERVVQADAEELLKAEMLNDWKCQQFQSFVRKSEYYSYCPGTDCSIIAFSEMGSGNAQCIKCNTSFCFSCGANPHAPATCGDVEAFMPLLNSSEYCVMKHAKRCPGCNIPIQRSQGCNHMTCTNCQIHFCWICLSVIDGYGDLDTHACNKFDPRLNFNTQERDEFFLSRFEASADGEVYAKRSLDSMTKKMVGADKDEDDQIMVKATECLIECRQCLKYSYIVGWAWHRDVANKEMPEEESSKPKEIFESHQATLAAFTESLNRLVETDAEKLRSTYGEWRFVVHLRALHFYTCALKLYSERMMDFISRCREMAN